MTPDTRVELRFLAYPIGGIESSTIESAKVTFDYETPGGNDEQEVFTIETDVSDSPEVRLTEVQQDQQIQEGFGWAVQALAVVGVLAVIALLGYVGLRLYKRRVGDGGGKGRRRR
jgi:hypothetical protein